MRTEIIEKNIFTYNELLEQAKEKARNWYKEGAAQDEWYDAVYDDAEQVSQLLGITLEHKSKHTPAIYFSGFWSQGDGACYEGSYRYAKGAPKAIKAYAPNDAELLRIAQALQDEQRRNFYSLRANASHTGRYSHSGCMSVNVYNSQDEYRDIGDAEDTITQLLRDFADWIYKRLEEEYEYLTSDEQAEEMILTNEYEFDEEGNII